MNYYSIAWGNNVSKLGDIYGKDKPIITGVSKD